MPDSGVVEAFESELRGLIDKYRHDWPSFSYAEIIGTMAIVQALLTAEAIDDDED